ncbi:hypothetical protein [Rhizorhabdus argentea]|uniref:hypothetical protein n=1 Tax=Rhizorhabdus argentea TaxID=1387174 RepID=UPI0030EDA063
MANGSQALGYCRRWSATLLLLIALAGLINALVDPYLVMGAPRIAGLNAAKPVTISHTQLAKDYLVQRIPARGLMLGSSKVEVGLDPASASWPADARPAFNYGVPGSGIHDALANLRRTIAQHEVRRVLILIELEEYMRPEAASGAALPQASPTPARLEAFRKAAGDKLLATLSTDALLASATTLLSQQDPNVIDLSPAGTMSEGGFRKSAASDGSDALFLQKDRMLIASFADMTARLKANPDAPLARLSALDELIVVCRRHGIKLDIAIAPFHSDYLDALDRAGLWPRYEQAKRALAALVADSGQGRVPLWDFLGYDRFSTEPIPAPIDRVSATRWFWEPSHFKQPLGEKILATIYRGGQDYGVPLTPGNVEARLLAERQARRGHRAEDRAGLDRLIRASQ